VYTILQPVTDEIIRKEMDSVLRTVPEWRRRKALSYKFDRDRYTCAKSYLLLKELLAARYGIRKDVEFEYGPYGKPSLKSFPEIHFNFSHCPKAVFCAIGDVPLGVDVEEIQNDENVAREVFSESECRLICSSPVPEIKFTEYWTQKEACLKLFGTGLTDDVRTLLEHPDYPVVFQTDVDIEGGFVSTVALYGERFDDRDIR